MRSSGYVRRLGAMVGANTRGRDLCRQLAIHLDRVGEAAAVPAAATRGLFRGSRDEPQISAIRWVSELMRHRRRRRYLSRSVHKRVSVATASSRTRSTLWPALPTSSSGRCGKKFRPERVAARNGVACRACGARWRAARDQVALILQPGPVCSPRVGRPAPDNRDLVSCGREATG